MSNPSNISTNKSPLKLFTVLYRFDGKSLWKNVAARTGAEAEQSFLDWVDGRYNVEVEDVEIADAIVLDEDRKLAPHWTLPSRKVSMGVRS